MLLHQVEVTATPDQLGLQLQPEATQILETADTVRQVEAEVEVLHHLGLHLLQEATHRAALQIVGVLHQEELLLRTGRPRGRLHAGLVLLQELLQVGLAHQREATHLQEAQVLLQEVAVGQDPTEGTRTPKFK